MITPFVWSMPAPSVHHHLVLYENNSVRHASQKHYCLTWHALDSEIKRSDSNLMRGKMTKRVYRYHLFAATFLLGVCLTITSCNWNFFRVGDTDQLLELRDGHVIVRSTQMPVYYSLDDRPGMSQCLGTCLRFFKPIEAPEKSNSKITSFLRPDGRKQAEYLGRPLYTSVVDSPGSPPKAHRIHDGWLTLTAL